MQKYILIYLLFYLSLPREGQVRGNRIINRQRNTGKQRATNHPHCSSEWFRLVICQPNLLVPGKQDQYATRRYTCDQHASQHDHNRTHGDRHDLQFRPTKILTVTQKEKSTSNFRSFSTCTRTVPVNDASHRRLHSRMYGLRE